ncbi:MAG TPA: TIGR03118 family protein, partial [Candidatus Acidoferrales bacterium]
MKLRIIALTVLLASALLFGAAPARAQYKVKNLVSNQAGTAPVTDPLIVNAWGLAYGPGGPFWISDQGSGWSTLYTNTGTKVPLNVLIPTAGGDGPGSPTGIVFNGSSDFKIKGAPAIFIFATIDGTISGWNPGVNPDAAVVAVTRPGAVYTGLAITTNPLGNFIFAADNANNKVDMYDGTFTLVKSFTDTTLPAGNAPFGIQDS